MPTAAEAARHIQRELGDSGGAEPPQQGQKKYVLKLLKYKQNTQTIHNKFTSCRLVLLVLLYSAAMSWDPSQCSTDTIKFSAGIAGARARDHAGGP